MKKTLRLVVDPQQPEMENMQLAANLIKEGGLVAFPTETVYGLGADALNETAVRSLFHAKRRPFDNPPIVHVSDVEDVYRLTKHVPRRAHILMKEFWPGPLTLIFRHSAIVPDVTVAGLDTIAIRMPKHNVALALIRKSKCPISAPSANLAGRPSPTSAQHVLDDLDGRIDAILDAGPTRIGVESTVLDLTVDPPEMLRPGGTTFEALKTILRNLKLSPNITAENPEFLSIARSPGIKHKHYAPRADVMVVEGETTAVIEKINELAQSYNLGGSRVGVLCTTETARHYNVDVVKPLGSKNDSATISRNLFRLLREFDTENVDVIIAEGMPKEGLGLAVMNRLCKAAAYKIVKAYAEDK